MSARLKLKRINDRIQGVMKMAQKAQYERDEINYCPMCGRKLTNH